MFAVRSFRSSLRSRLVLAAGTALLFLVVVAPALVARPRPDGEADLRVRDWLTLSSVDQRGRRPFRPDAVFARYLLERDAPPPVEGEEVSGELGSGTWERRDVGEGGGPAGGSMAWAYGEVESDADRVVLAELAGALTIFVNGEAFVGDLYRYGFGGVPVALRRGVNRIFVTGIRGGFRLRFVRPHNPILLGSWDHTLPEFVAGEGEVGPAGVLVLNATNEAMDCLEVHLAGDEDFAPLIRRMRPLKPLEVAKLELDLALQEGKTVPSGVKLMRRSLLVGCRDEFGFDSEVLELSVVEPDATRRRTFTSAIDESAQFYGLRPAAPPEEIDERPGLVLTLHGAGVDAMNQVRCYAPQPDLWYAAPTNRRPFGFDWQDWGRADAYEVLIHALGDSGADPSRVYLTGHSMGGHGVWHLAANDPDGFAAIAPSAGWAGFDSYGGRPVGALDHVWKAADGASLTLDLLPNLAPTPTFVLHGAADDNVPVSEAEAMLAALRGAGASPGSHVQPDAGHWWDGDVSPGVDCVDWPEITELFRDSRIAGEPHEIAFLTVDPGVDRVHHWLSAEQPLRYGRPMALAARWDEDARQVTVTTDNVRHFLLRPPTEAAELRVRVDGTDVGIVPGGRFVGLLREDGWAVGRSRSWDEKRPERCGPFKKAFDNGFVLVVGTKGTDAETAELLARARYDAGVWWYRANGRALLLTDDELFERRGAFDLRNVILYGNADTNGAWHRVLPRDCPIEARRGRLRVGDETWTGDDLGAAFVYRKEGTTSALVGVFADTGVSGTRVGYTLAPFVSGVGYPDYAVFGSDVLLVGDGGVRTAGWFDHEWRLDPESAHSGHR